MGQFRAPSPPLVGHERDNKAPLRAPSPHSRTPGGRRRGALGGLAFAGAAGVLRAGSEAGGAPEFLDAVGPLPGEVGLLPAEVTEGRRLRVDRPEQVKGLDD